MLRDVAAAGLLVFAACSSTTTGTGPSSSSTSSSTSSSAGGTTADPTCNTRCEEHATDCSLPVPKAKCDPFCPATSAAVDCVSRLDCAVMRNVGTYRSVCAGGGDTSTSSSSGCPTNTSSSGDLGAGCDTGCSGFGPCNCRDGCIEDQPLTCISGTCIPNCTPTYVCQGHGGT